MPTRARKTKSTSSADDFIHIRIDSDLKAKLVAIAKRSGNDLSNYARSAMIEKAKRDGHEI
jgi:hypothetical protein